MTSSACETVTGISTGRRCTLKLDSPSPGDGSTATETTLPESMTMAPRWSRGPPKMAWASRTRPSLEARAAASSATEFSSLPL